MKIEKVQRLTSKYCMSSNRTAQTTVSWRRGTKTKEVAGPRITMRMWQRFIRGLKAPKFLMFQNPPSIVILWVRALHLTAKGSLATLIKRFKHRGNSLALKPKRNSTALSLTNWWKMWELTLTRNLRKSKIQILTNTWNQLISSKIN
jgi:hypothetical protein